MMKIIICKENIMLNLIKLEKLFQVMQEFSSTNKYLHLILSIYQDIKIMKVNKMKTT